MSRSLTRETLTSRAPLQGILYLVVFVVLLQVWLLSATTSAWLGGDDSILWPAAAASAVCALVNYCFLRYLQPLAD